MIYLRTRLEGILFLTLILTFSISCNKEVYVSPRSEFVNSEKPTMVKDWTRLSLDLIPKCNGFNDLISSRAMFYLSITMYESLLPGLEGYHTLQTKINGLNTTLPQPNSAKEYNWLIVSNQAVALMCSELFKAAGTENLNKVTALRDKNIAAASANLNETIIYDSKELGNEIGWKMIEFSKTDGRADYYLKLYNDITMPVKEGGWIPTPPDYSDKILLPTWGESKPAYEANVSEIQPYRNLDYSTSAQSIMYAEALEVYNLTTHLSAEDRDLINYWNESSDARSTPLCHNLLLLTQMLDESNFALDKSVELLLRMSIAHYDGYILSWKIKFESNLLRPSTYIKQNISHYFIPEFSCTPIPEFASEKALIYNASAEILSNFFGHRTSFIDFTQAGRPDIQNSKKYFASFSEMAKEASYSDLYSAVHFRTSIDVGLQMGYDISLKTLAINLK